MCGMSWRAMVANGTLGALTVHQTKVRNVLWIEKKNDNARLTVTNMTSIAVNHVNTRIAIFVLYVFIGILPANLTDKIA